MNNILGIAIAAGLIIITFLPVIFFLIDLRKLNETE